MNPTDICNRAADLRKELRDLDRAVEDLAASVVRDGVPASWGAEDRDNAYLLFTAVRSALPPVERYAARAEILRAAAACVAAAS